MSPSWLLAKTDVAETYVQVPASKLKEVHALLCSIIQSRVEFNSDPAVMAADAVASARQLATDANFILLNL